MSWAEVLGFATGAACVWLAVKENVWNWPLGIANSAFWSMLFFGHALYLNAGLQLLYIALGFYGWYWWLWGGERRDELPVTRMSRATATAIGAWIVIGTILMWWVEARFTDSTVPFWDAATTVVSLAAQWMLTRKLYGNWWLWIMVDVVYTALYASQDLWLTAALQPIFAAMCVRGLIDWRRTMRSAEAPVDDASRVELAP